MVNALQVPGRQRKFCICDGALRRRRQMPADGRGNDVPKLHGYSRGEGFDARTGTFAVRSSSGPRSSVRKAGAMIAPGKHLISAWPAKAANPNAQCRSTWLPTRLSFCPITMLDAFARFQLTRSGLSI